MLKRIFSKKSGFTLVEIIIAFAVFAIMSAMILQILNIVAFQRKSNTELSETIDEQEQYLIEHNKNPFNSGADTDGTLSFDFGAGGKFDVSYQMNGATETGEVDGLAYFVADKAVNTNPPEEDDDDDDDNDVNDNGGSQMDRFDTRITGTKGFSFVKVNQVVKVREEDTPNGKLYVYAFDLSAQIREVDSEEGAAMNISDIPYANYRLYFYTPSRKVAPIAYANYLNDANSNANLVDIANGGSKAEILTSTGATSSSPSPYNIYTVSITGTNGIRIGSPFKSGSGSNNNNNNNGNDNTPRYRCRLCGKTFVYDWEGHQSKCPNAPAPGYESWQDVHFYYLEPYTPPASPAAPGAGDSYSGNGIKFTESNHTRIEIAFTVDPELTVNSFGANSNNGEYKSDKVVGGVKTGSNIYGAFPK